MKEKVLILGIKVNKWKKWAQWAQWKTKKTNTVPTGEKERLHKYMESCKIIIIPKSI